MAAASLIAAAQASEDDDLSNCRISLNVHELVDTNTYKDDADDEDSKKGPGATGRGFRHCRCVFFAVCYGVRKSDYRSDRVSRDLQYVPVLKAEGEKVKMPSECWVFAGRSGRRVAFLPHECGGCDGALEHPGL